MVGVTDEAVLESIRKSVQKTGYRTTVISSIEQCAETTARRTFLSAFLDFPFFQKLARRCPFSVPTYTVVVATPREVPRALSLQEEGKIHDWLASPIREENVRALLLRARTFLRMAGELERIQATTANAIRNDSGLLRAGKWAETAHRWIESIRKGNNPLLLLGEPGTGKRLLAQLIHYSSPRASSPFLIVPCRDRNVREFEKEIFGEIPPRNRPAETTPFRSTFALAADGTVLLDEIECLPRRLQQRIAHTILSKTFSPVGGGDRVKMEARLIFTLQETGSPDPVRRLLHPDLGRMLRRSALLIPPLRQRKEDFPLIVRSVSERLSREFGVRSPGITEEAVERLQEHYWPGNLRELEGVIWAASVLAGPSKISGRSLAPFLSHGDQEIKDEEEALEGLIENRLSALFRRFGVEHLKDLHPMILERVERPLLSLVLKQTKGNQVRAAQVLGINRNTLRRKMKEFRGHNT